MNFAKPTHPDTHNQVAIHNTWSSPKILTLLKIKGGSNSARNGKQMDWSNLTALADVHGYQTQPCCTSTIAYTLKSVNMYTVIEKYT